MSLDIFKAYGHGKEQKDNTKKNKKQRFSIRC